MLGVNHSNNTSHIWRAINELTGKSTCNNTKKIPFTAEQFSNHFLSSIENIRSMNNGSPSSAFHFEEKIKNMRKDCKTLKEALTIPLVTIEDVKKLIYKLKNKKISRYLWFEYTNHKSVSPLHCQASDVHL